MRDSIGEAIGDGDADGDSVDGGGGDCSGGDDSENSSSDDDDDDDDDVIAFRAAFIRFSYRVSAADTRSFCLPSADSDESSSKYELLIELLCILIPRVGRK